MIGARTRSRELALQALYTRELVKQDPELAFASTLSEAEVPESVRDHARTLAHGVVAHIVALDAEIASAAENWELTRLATIDRNVMRLALFEMLHTSDVPPRVAINEAIELGKRFSTAQSGAFINGVLDQVRKQHNLAAGDPPAEIDTARSLSPGTQPEAPKPKQAADESSPPKPESPPRTS